MGLGRQDLLGSVDMPPHGGVEGIRKGIFKQTSNVFVKYAGIEILNHLFDEWRGEGATLRGWTLEWEMEQALGKGLA